MDHHPRKAVPVFDQPLGKEMFPNVKSEPPLNHSYVICHWVPGRRAQHLPLYMPSSGSCEITPQRLFSKLDKLRVPSHSSWDMKQPT